MIVQLQLNVRPLPSEDVRSPQSVFDLDVHVNSEVADEVCALVMRHLADRNAHAVAADG